MVPRPYERKELESWYIIDTFRLMVVVCNGSGRESLYHVQSQRIALDESITALRMLG